MDAHPDTTRSWKARRVIGLGLTVLLVSLVATLSWAGDLPKLGSLRADPASYKLKIVRVAGMVTGLRVKNFTGNTTKRQKCIQYFTVKDDTGTMEAVYATICPGGAVMLRNGDHVTIEARFERAEGTAGLLKVQSVVKKRVPSA